MPKKTPPPPTEAPITPPRYSKRVKGVKIDPYRIIELYGIQHPAHQHAIKKLLRNGNDPHQTLDDDIEEVIGALQRWQEMRAEERSGSLNA